MGKKDRTIWWCDTCHASGIAALDASLFDALDQLGRAHDTHELALANRHAFDVGTIHVQLQSATGAPEDGRT